MRTHAHRLSDPLKVSPPTSTITSSTKTTVKLWIFKVRWPLVQKSARSPVAAPLVTSAAAVPVDCLASEAAAAAPNSEPATDPDGGETTYTFSRHAIRSNYMDKSIEAKKKVIRMLFVVVVEFFVCWAPLHVLNTWYLFSPDFVYRHVSSTGVSLVQLLAYISSCCNPITYCFMNRRFRQAFLGIFSLYKWRLGCCGVKSGPGPGGCALDRLGEGAGTAGPNNSEVSGNESTVYMGRGCRSETVVLDAEERV